MADPVFLGSASVGALAAIVVIWVHKTQSFSGKPYYILTFLGMIWTLLAVGLEAASVSFECQYQWATWAWPGNALVPVAWCFFVFAYVRNAPWVRSLPARLALVIVPSAIVALAFANPWHGLVYTDASAIPEGGTRIDYAHGPLFYGFIGTLYVFVMAALVCLIRTFARARREAWPLLSMLVLITMTPLTANAAYVGFGLTVFGLDPTAFMFSVGILAFTWLMVTNKTMDMASVSKSVLFDTMSEPVILIDRQRNIVLTNSAARRRNLHENGDLVPGDLVTEIERQDTSGEVPHLTIGQRLYEPRVQRIESPLDPSGAWLGWSVTLVDITERVAMHSALQEALQRADDANRAKDDFISVVSHEMRTPLTSLRGGLSLALGGRLGELSEPMRASLDIAHRNGVRLSRLVDNILLAQKIEIEALSLASVPVDLAVLLEDSFKENRMFAAERGVRLVAGQVDRPAMVMGDAFAIRQIIDNLVSNALKFSYRDGVVEGTIRVMDRKVRLSIRDSGRGIPDGMEGQVFGRFGQVANDGQGATQGSGLGLHISKQLAVQMSGRLYYDSEVGVGSTFHVEFDLLEQAQTEPSRLAC